MTPKHTRFRGVPALVMAGVLLALAGCGADKTNWESGPGSTTPPATTPPPTTPPTTPPPIPPVTPPPVPGDTTAPTAPTSLTATADGPFGMKLSWTASTDNVGVTGYRVERCKGAACSTFAQVATPAGASFTDTGLEAATSYSYQVRARDAVGNLSAYSSVASATTAASTPPPPGALPSWVAALAIGQWVQIPNTAMSSVAPSPTPEGNTGPESKVVAWTSFVVDTRTSKVYSVANGGHGDYAGNEVDVLNLETAAPAWSQVLAPSPAAAITDCQNYYTDGRPAARHTYYGVMLNEFNDRIMLFGGAIYCSLGGFFTPISSYNIAANNYSPSNTHLAMPSAFAGVTAYSLDPATGDVYAFLNGIAARWTRSSNTFVANLNATGNNPDGLEAMSAMDPTRGRILIAGGLNGTDHHFYTLSSNSFTSVVFNGANASIIPSSSQGGMFYVAAIDRFLFKLDNAGGTVYQIHPSTFEVTTFATTNGGSIPLTQNGPYNKFLYVPRLGGAVYVPSYFGNAWFLRVH